jgi:toxin ParE1/3/4
MAEADLAEIGDYIAADSPARAVSFLEELRTTCHRLTDMPKAYPRRLALAEGIRAAPYGNYLILYSDHADHVLIERVLHGARNLDEMF